MIDSLVLHNKSTNKSVTIDKDTSAFVLGEVDFGTVPGTHYSYKFLNQIGVYIDSTALEQREISINGWVIGNTYSQLREYKAILNALINPLHEIEIIAYDTYAITFKPDYSIQYSTTDSENNEVLCKFLIQGTCANPMFTTPNKQTQLLAYDDAQFHFPLVIPESSGVIFGTRIKSVITNIINKGDVPVGMTITFTAKGSVKNPSLVNVYTQSSLKISKTLESGESIVISTLDGDKYVKGTLNGVTSNYFSYLDLDSTWIQLSLGDNILKYDAEEGVDNLDMSIDYYPQYLEVQ